MTKLKLILISSVSVALLLILSYCGYSIYSKNKEIDDLNREITSKNILITGLELSRKLDAETKEIQLKFTSNVRIELEKNQREFTGIRNDLNKKYSKAEKEDKSKVLIESLWSTYEKVK